MDPKSTVHPLLLTAGLRDQGRHGQTRSGAPSNCRTVFEPKVMVNAGLRPFQYTDATYARALMLTLGSLPFVQGCTASVTALVDVQPLASKALSMKSGTTPGLRHACAALLGVEVNKAQQTSDWEQRPLTEAQLVYAATDAAVLPLLYGAVLARG